LGLRQLPSQETRELLARGTAVTTFLQMGLEISKLRPLQQAPGGKRTKHFVPLMLGPAFLLMLKHTFLRLHWVSFRLRLI